jgi:hypothetical protein
MNVSEPDADSPRSSVSADGNWKVPLMIVASAPLITVPLTVGLAGSLVSSGACLQVGFNGGYDYFCRPISVALTLLPGLVNLVPAFWLLSSTRRTRTAATVAATLGFARLVLPVTVVLSSAAALPAGTATGAATCGPATGSGWPEHVAMAPDASAGPLVEIASGFLTPTYPNDTQFFVVILSLVLWCGTFVAWAAIGSQSHPSKS